MRTSSASFPPEPVSARGARRFLRAFSGACGVSDEVTDPAELALSEVVTNVVLHAHTAFEVVVALDDHGRLRVEVTDSNPQLPVQRHYAGQATTGRGMELVAAMTEDCGVQARGTSGKTVWFVVRATDQGDADGSGATADWDIDPVQAAESAAGQESVVLLGLPSTLWLAARQHHDAVMRELALYAAEHPLSTVTPERIALADRARAWISAHLVAELDRRARSAGEAGSGQPASSGRTPPPHLERPGRPAGIDLVLAVPADAAAAFGAMQDVLDTAEQLAVAGLLLARPALPEIVAVRDWACEQAIAQLSGVAPSRWSGTDQERFTVEVRDRAGAAAPDWDAGVVTDSARGAVAGDDSNRILAISRSLAAALGWAVDDLVGRRVVALIPPELREAHVAGFTRHLTTGETHVLGVPLQLPVLRADGTTVLCDVLIEALPPTTGRRVYVAWIEPVAES